MVSPEKGEMTVSQAGRKGGRVVMEKYGSEFYVRIGRLGGLALLESRGLEFFQEIGRKGGEAVRDAQAQNPEYYSRIGRMGSKLRGRERFS